MPDSTSTATWTDANLVAIDLEGSGPQDPHGEAILEIALVPIRAGAPDVEHAYTTLINPGRKITRGPWTSPGLTNAVLATAPTLAEVTATITDIVDGAILVGHNVHVDWRLLHARIPDATPTGLVDTLRLAKNRHPELKKGHGLAAWIDRLDLTDTISALAPGSQPHRALWDTAGAAELLRAFMKDAKPADRSLDVLLATAGVPLANKPEPTDQPSLWDVP